MEAVWSLIFSILRLWNFCQLNGLSHCGLNLQFSDIEHLFIYLIFPLLRNVFSYPLPTGLLIVFSLTSRSSLYILDDNPFGCVSEL